LLLLFCFLPIARAASPAPPAPPKPALEALWLSGGGRVSWRAFDKAGQPLDASRLQSPKMASESAVSPDAPGKKPVPLGSLWKLLVYLWLVETKHPAPDYVCTGASGNSAAARALREEESYCCEPGQGIDRDTALVRSCGLFFSPKRLGIRADAWKKFWGNDGGLLSELAAMKPETKVAPTELLSVLAGDAFGHVAPQSQLARAQATNVLLARAFGPNHETETIRYLGGRLRVKTFSWFLPDGSRYGGGAGWLVNGTPIWFAGEGTGQQIMARYAKALAAVADEAMGEIFAPRAALAPGCVRVRLFARYPLLRVEKPGGEVARAGVLHGRHIAVFEPRPSSEGQNHPQGKHQQEQRRPPGQRRPLGLPFVANGALVLSMEEGRPRLDARLSLEDYVARVIDREGDARETEAARALAVVARSYLLNEARAIGNCLVIEDSSRTQRVSPNPPSAAARAVAAFTSGLILSGAPVGYHSDKPGANRMSWKAAVAAGRAGQSWDAILRHALPKADLAAMHDPAGTPCPPFAEAEAWLARQTPGWQRILARDLPGFEAPPAPQICRLAYGRPFSEQDRNRIHLSNLKSAEDRITLAHEYLHLGLAHHPSGHDETLVEDWARKLILTGGDIHEHP
jgi:uncharacterized protein YfaQ (DUF2300 family)